MHVLWMQHYWFEPAPNGLDTMWRIMSNGGFVRQEFELSEPSAVIINNKNNGSKWKCTQPLQGILSFDL